MKKYEIMYIVRPTVSEEELAGVVKKFNDLLTDNGAKVVETEEMGQRELAYEIKDFRTGYYYLLKVESENEKATKEFDRVAGISNDIIRHLITGNED